MNAGRKKVIVYVALVILAAMLCRNIGRELPGRALGIVRSLLYLGLFAAWGISLRRRVIQPQARHFLTSIAGLIVFWLLDRTIKYFFVVSAAAVRYLWYGFYLPMLFIPLFAVFVAASLDMLQNGASREETERQVKKLSVAAGTLVYTPGAGSDDPYDALLAQAAELGVEIRLDGMLPLEPDIYDLVVQAVRECMTNCVRHAHGTAVFVRIVGIPGGYTVIITNDGKKPHGPIREGSGLSALRQSIENAGGEMSLSHYPEFLLRFTLMREEMEL